MKDISSISVVIPLYNEEENVEELYGETSEVLRSLPYDFEIIFVNDGSTDRSETVLSEIYAKDSSHVRVINFNKNYGKALALKAGFALASGDTIITMDADLQDDPKEIPRFIEKIQEGYDLISGWKYKRLDSKTKNITSKIYNLVTSVTSRIHLHDHNCGFKAYTATTAKNLPLYAQLHRYIPLLAHSLGYERITEIKINHRKRIHGKSKYGPMRFIHGITGLYHALYLARLIKHTHREIPAPSYHLKNTLV